MVNTSHGLTNAKQYSHTCTYYIVYTTKVPNIVTVLLVTVIETVNISGQSENNRDKWIMEKMRSDPHTVTRVA